MGEFGTSPKTCKACGCAILWLRNETSGRIAPIELLPSEGPKGGNIETDIEKGTYRIVSPPRHDLPVNHFVTCPAKSPFRKLPPSARRGERPGRCGT